LVVPAVLAAKQLPSINSKPSFSARARPTNSGAVHMRGASAGCSPAPKNTDSR
jgi:hypothetical protein